MIKKIAFSMSTFMFVISGLVFSAAGDESQPPTITVSGTAEVRVVPDEAVLTFSIESREKTLDAAVQDNDEKVKSVTDFLKESKLNSTQVRTEVIRIQPIYEQNDSNRWKGQIAQSIVPNAAPRAEAKKDRIKPVGFTARRSMSITVVDLASFEAIYRGLIKRGVNEVGGVKFRTTELRKHRDEARRKAMIAAKEKADAMAGELGATVSAVQTITEDSGSRYSNFAQNSFSPAVVGSTNDGVAAGVIEVTASVRVVFRLADVEFKSGD